METKTQNLEAKLIDPIDLFPILGLFNYISRDNKERSLRNDLYGPVLWGYNAILSTSALTIGSLAINYLS